MITWMNQNQGFIMCVLTFVYVVATVIIVIMNILNIHQEIESIVPENATTLANVRWRDQMKLKNEIA